MSTLSDEQKDYLNQRYYDISLPAAFTSGEKFHHQLVKEGRADFSKQDIEKWLNHQEAHTVHKPVRKTFKHRRVLVESIDEQWDCDLMVFESSAKFNEGNKYVLLCIDTLSKYVWTRPLKSKTGAETKKAFQSIFSGARKCLRLRSDMGKEFCNTTVEKYFKEVHIKHFVTYNSVKANFAERAIKTIKQRLFKYFTHKQTYRYIDILQDITANYNATYHRSIRMAPQDVTRENQQVVWENIYGHDIFKMTTPPQKVCFKVGDLVRISHTRNAFARGYNQGWSDELFTIKTAHKTSPPTYTLKDYAGETILGRVYEQEVTKVFQKEDAQYKIEKVLKKRRVRGKTEYLVKWLGWNKSFNSWVDSTDIEDL